MKKKGQLEIGFNWIYILIAGAVILMFFIGIVIKQKVVSEEKLSAEVLQRIEGIFTGAGVSPKTTDDPEVPLMTLRFVCDEETGYSDYSIGGTSIKSETAWQPIFASEKVTGRRLYTWTLEWNFPFKVINYLFISSPGIKYYLFSNEYLFPDFFNVEYVDSYNEIEYHGEDYVKLVFDGDLPNNGGIPFTSALRDVPDNKVSAVAFIGPAIVFYEKEDDRFKKIGESPLIGSMTNQNPNAYGAIFASDWQSYNCNLKKAMTRLRILSRIYGKRIDDIQSRYTSGSCTSMVEVDLFYGGADSLEKIAERCMGQISNCMVRNTAQDIMRQNDYFIAETACPRIY